MAGTIWDIDLCKRFRPDQRDGPGVEVRLQFRSDHERVVLRGPSGIGKTVMLRLMAGVLRPDGGHVIVGGEVLADCARGLFVAPSKRRLGVVFQEYRLFPHLTVRQNVAYARRRGWRNPGRLWRDGVVDRWLGAMGLDHVATSYPHQISGGQRQRVALARALALQPRALLLDEPFAALDQELRVQLRDELLELQQMLAIPLLLVTHDPEDVRHLAQDVVEMPAT